MSEVLELNIEEPKKSAAEKRARVEEELRRDAGRSDRAIGRLCAVDGKLVGRVRAELAPAVLACDEAPAALRQAAAEVDDGDDDEPAGYGDGGYFSADNIAVHHQPMLAVYCNPHGAIVIREDRLGADDEDSFVVVRPENVEQLIKKLREVARALLDDEQG